VKSHTTTYTITADRPMDPKAFRDAKLNIHQVLQLLPRTFFDQVREAVITTRRGVSCKLTTRPVGHPDDPKDINHLEVRITITEPQQPATKSQSAAGTTNPDPMIPGHPDPYSVPARGV
jgi:hypothetical protein